MSRGTDGALNITQEHIRRQLVSSLTNVVETGVDQLGEKVVAGILRDLATELDGDGGGRVCRFSQTDDGPVLTLCYEAATALEKEIDILTEVCGLMVEVDPPPPMMEILDVVIEGEGCDLEVVLSGRAVHQSDDGVALELTAPGDGDKKALARLVEKMRVRSEEGDKQEALEEAPGSADQVPSGPSEVVEDQSQSVGDEPSEVKPHRAPPVEQTRRRERKPTGPHRTTQPQPPPKTMEWHPAQPKTSGLLELPDRVVRRWSPGATDMATILMESTTIDGYGVLEFGSANKTRQLVLHFGNLIGFRSDPPEASRRLISQLRSKEMASSTEIQKAQQAATRDGLSLEEALVDTRTITHPELIEATQARITQQLHGLWDCEFDEARLYALEHRPFLEIRCSVALVPEVVNHFRRRFSALSQEQLEDAEEEFFGGNKICGRSDLLFGVDEMGLGSKQERFMEILFEKPRTIFELKRIANLHYGEMMIMLLLLRELGGLSLQKKQRQSPELRRLKALRSQVDRSENHFDLFGLHWSAYDTEVEKKYRELSARLDVPSELEAQMADEIESLRTRIDAAYAVLSNRRSRRAHREEHIDAYSRKNAAQMYENKVESLQMRSDKRDLLDALKRYLELKPNDTEAQKMAAALEHRAAEEAK